MTAGPSRGFFDAWSTFYDFPLLQRATYRPVHNAILRTLGPDPRTILDVGCGTGQLAARLAERRDTTRLVGIDFSAGMLAHAAERLRAARPNGAAAAVDFVRGDATRLPLRNGSFDAIVSSEAFHWFPDQDAALRECFRVLVPGGRLILVFVNPPFAAISDAFQAASRMLGQPLYWPTPAELRGRLTTAGFRVEDQRRVFRIPGFLLPPLLTEARRP
jgi:ubiquinone/menaquinone biosynthesis C-methylase UbiE